MKTKPPTSGHAGRGATLKQILKMFNRQIFDETLTAVARHYWVSAPTVGDWCDMLAAAKDEDITLADLSLLERLGREKPHPHLAANLVYHRMEQSSKATLGQAGF